MGYGELRLMVMMMVMVMMMMMMMIMIMMMMMMMVMMMIVLSIRDVQVDTTIYVSIPLNYSPLLHNTNPPLIP
jgi:hypothetical protein